MTVMTGANMQTKARTTTDIRITSETVESTEFTVFDDILDGFIPFSDEDYRGGGDESCDSIYEECDRTARYYVMYADPRGGQDNHGRRYLCPRHYAQYLHFILDSMRTNDDMWDLDNEGTRRAIRAYVTGYGPISNR